MSQRPLASGIESLANVVAGYGIALASQIVLFPIYGIEVNLRTNVVLGLWFTAVSLVRSFILRRVFNHLTHRSK